MANGRCNVNFLKPSKAGLSCIFWRMCLHSPHNIYSFSFFVLLEELAKILVTLRLSFTILVLEQSIQSIYTNSSLTLYFIIANTSLIVFLILNTILMYYQYKTVLRIGKRDPGSTFLQISFKYQSCFFSLYATLLQFLFAILGVASVYQLIYSKDDDNFSSSFFIAQCFLISILMLSLFAMYFVNELFFNIMTINMNLVQAKADVSQFLYFKPV